MSRHATPVKEDVSDSTLAAITSSAQSGSWLSACGLDAGASAPDDSNSSDGGAGGGTSVSVGAVIDAVADG